MKQTLRLRGELCPKNKLYTKILYTIYITFTIVLVSCVCTRAQVSASSQEAGPAAEAVSEIKPLKIGDTIPDALWNMPLQMVKAGQEGTSTVTLNDYKGKLIILDFWATWCGACIEGFPKMEQLQNKFKDVLKVILVNAKTTGDSEKKVSAYLEKREKYTGKKMWLPYLVQDTVFSKLFPYRYVPHYVWLNDGTVQAITSSLEVNDKNIQSMMGDRANTIHTKKDIIDFNDEKPLFDNGNGKLGDAGIYRSTLTKYIEGIGRKAGKNIDEERKVTRYYLLNMPLINMYRRAFRDLLRVPNNQLIIDVKEPARFAERTSSYDNLYCYEVIAPATTMGNMLEYLREDLNRVFQVSVRKEKRTSDAWVLTATEKAGNILLSEGGEPTWLIDKSSKEKYIRNKPISAMVDLLNAYSPIPVIDETGISSPIDIQLPSQFFEGDMDQVRRYFLRYGLILTRGHREIDFTIIND